MPSDIIYILNNKRFSLHNEKTTQEEIGLALGLSFHPSLIFREYFLDHRNIIDFLIDGRIGIEVKLKGAKMEIYRQCERYCGFERIQTLILVTNITMGFPPEINGKPCYVIKLGQAWL